MVKNPCNAGDMSLIPGQGTKISMCKEQLSLHIQQLEKPMSNSEDATYFNWHPMQANK